LQDTDTYTKKFTSPTAYQNHNRQTGH